MKNTHLNGAQLFNMFLKDDKNKQKKEHFFRHFLRLPCSHNKLKFIDDNRLH